MNIQEKIAQIRLEPEHIRLRYVWGSVAVSMVIILAIWIFSMGSLFQGDENSAEMPGIQEQFQALKEQAPSIDNLTDQSWGIQSEGVTNTNSATDFQYPTITATEEAPQANAYSDLPATPVQ